MNTTARPLRQVHLSPGQLLVTREPLRVATILGSCVAVTMFSRKHSLAAMCHAMLPQPRGDEVMQPNDRSRFRYVSHAVPAMIEHFECAGIKMREIEVKVFGGANVIDLGGAPSGDWLIGSANIAITRRLLQAAHLVVTAESVGGGRGCKILFNTATGDVLHRHLHPDRT